MDAIERERERLRREARGLMNVIPPEVATGSINLVRRWRLIREGAEKVVGNPRSSADALRYIIRSLKDWNK